MLFCFVVGKNFTGFAFCILGSSLRSELTPRFSDSSTMVNCHLRSPFLVLDRGRNRQHLQGSHLLLIGANSNTERIETICFSINPPTATSSDIRRVDVRYRVIVPFGTTRIHIVQTIVLLSSRFSATYQKQVISKSQKPVAKSRDDHILKGC